MGVGSRIKCWQNIVGLSTLGLHSSEDDRFLSHKDGCSGQTIRVYLSGRGCQGCARAPCKAPPSNRRESRSATPRLTTTLSPAGCDPTLAHRGCPLAWAGSDRQPPRSVQAVFPSSHPFPNFSREHCTTERLCFSGTKHKHVSEAL